MRILLMVLMAVLLSFQAFAAPFPVKDIVSPVIIRNVDTISDLRGTVGNNYLQAVQVAGYYADGDGGGGPVRYWDPSSTCTDNGGSCIDPSPIDANPGRWVWPTTTEVSVRWFGAKLDGVSDDTVMVQAAVDSLEKGTVDLEGGDLAISTTLLVKHAVSIIADGHGGDGANVSGYVAPVSRIKWIPGSGALPMVIIKHADFNSTIYRSRYTGFLLDGSEEATTGILAQSVSDCVFDVACFGVTIDAIRVDDGNGSQSNFNDINLYHISGVSAATENANSFALVAKTFPVGYVAAGCSQNEIDVTSVLDNGYNVVLSGCDNNLVKHVGGGRAVGGTGKAVWLREGAWVNVLSYVTGGVLADAGTYGNRVRHITSEGGGVTLQGDATVFYEASDYVTGEIWSTPSFPMVDNIVIPIGATSPETATGCSFSTIAAYWQSLKYSGGLTSNAKATVAGGKFITDGDIVGIRITYTTSSANSGATVDFLVRLLCQRDGLLIATPTVDESFTDVVIDAATSVNVLTHTFTAPAPVYKGSPVMLQLYRLGASASDTVVGDIHVLGIELLYESDGPTNITSGSFDIPAY